VGCGRRAGKGVVLRGAREVEGRCDRDEIEAVPRAAEVGRGEEKEQP